MLVQNKDDLRIPFPLLLEVLPSAKAFQKATQSLSPEQHAFCKAYRALQLESSLLGVVVIPLQPQLQKTQLLQATLHLTHQILLFQAPTLLKLLRCPLWLLHPPLSALTPTLSPPQLLFPY